MFTTAAGTKFEKCMPDYGSQTVQHDLTFKEATSIKSFKCGVDVTMSAGCTKAKWQIQGETERSKVALKGCKGEVTVTA